MERPDFLNKHGLFLVSSDDILQLVEYFSNAVKDNHQKELSPTSEERPLTQNEAAKFLGKSRQTLTNWRRKGFIVAYRISGRIYYKPSELIAALKRLG